MIQFARLSIALLLEVITLCLLASLRYINAASTVTLLIFNILFASIIFQLNGTVHRKLCLLAAGNVAGLFWNLVFFYYSSAGTLVFGTNFDALYTIAYPLLNLMWVVPFWSLSLGFLPRGKTTRLGGNET